MDIAFGMFALGGTEPEIYLGVIYPPPTPIATYVLKNTIRVNSSNMPTIHPTWTIAKALDMMITHVCAFVCMCVRILKGKRLELSTPKLVGLRV